MATPSSTFASATVDIGVRRIAHRLATDLSSLVEQLTQDAAQQLDRAVEEARRAGQAEIDARVASQLDAARAEDARQLAAAIERVRTDGAAMLAAERARLGQADATSRAIGETDLGLGSDGAAAGERDTVPAIMQRLLQATRRLDEAVALSDVLDALGSAAAAETARVAVLVAHGGGLQGWRFDGFGHDLDARRGQPIHEAEQGAIGRALRSGEPCFAQPLALGGASGSSFADLPPGRVGLAVPVCVGGRVVAIVYADDAGDGMRPARAWPEAIEVLARHASRCLESLTARRAAQMGSA